MLITLDIPEALFEEAGRLLGSKSETETVMLALRELVRKGRVDELKSMMGAVYLEFDLSASRRRT